MSDQFALGLLAQLVEQLTKRVDELEKRLSDVEAVLAEAEGAQYLDGSHD